jgi:hypothetical protein
MGNERQLDDILNDCIERLAAGESIADCIAAHPRHEEELTPLLEVAAATLQAASSTTYSPAAKARGLDRLNEAIASRSERKWALFRWPGWRSPVARPVVAGISVVLVVAATAMGADAMASDSAPGDALYWIKTSKENLSLRMPKSDAAKAQEHARLAGERTHEVGQLIDQGKFVEAERHSAQVGRQLTQSAQLVGLRMSTNPIELPARTVSLTSKKDLEDLKARLHRNRIVSSAMLSAYLRTVPPSDRQMVVDMMRRNELVYRAMIAVLESGDGAAWPPFYRTEPPRSSGR